MASHKKHKRKCIQYSDPGKILDLVMSLVDGDCAQLQIKINGYLAEECESELVLQIIVNRERMEAYIEAVGVTPLPKKVKICMFHKLTEIMKGNVEQIDYFANFPDDVRAIITPFLEEKSVPKARVVMFPVADKPFSALVCVVSPRVLDEHAVFYVQECFLFTWPTIKKAIALEYECILKQKCQQLLRVARRLFTLVESLDTLLKMAKEQARLLARAECCKVMLIDADTMQLVDKSPGCGKMDSKGASELRFALNIGITGQVIQSGSLINAKVAKEHPAYDPTIDGADTKSILCFPIREQTGIIGVGQLINKIGDPYFDSMDEELALSFSIYCGVCIIHSVVYEKIQEAHIRNALANELVMYHMKVTDSEVRRLLECSGYHNHPQISSLHFNARALPPRELPCYVLKMFSDLGFDKKFNLRPQKLACFVLYVKRGYRDVPYHNWHHAFNVAQWAYAALVNFRLISNGYLTELQGFMFFVAGLLHDLDHRGTTNGFQIQGQSNLAALYSSEGSVMERHHLAQAMCILNTEGCDILEALPRKDYDRCIMLLRDYILATDLANYFKNLNEYKTFALDFQKGNRLHSSALQALLMNGADLSDQLKEWGSVKKTAAAVLSEFFKQGDVEKSRGDVPITMMDREKCFIPELEIGFLQNTCVPLYDTLGKILPKAAPCVRIIENHMERWDGAKPVFAEVPISAGLSILLSPELDNLIELNLQEKERLRIEAEEAAIAAAAAAEAAAAAAAAAEDD